jgi:hypothetical protein
MNVMNELQTQTLQRSTGTTEKQVYDMVQKRTRKKRCSIGFTPFNLKTHHSKLKKERMIKSLLK